MESEPRPSEPEDDTILHFVLDGVMYALKQNQMTQEQAWNLLKDSFPDVRIVPEDIYKTRTNSHKKPR